MGRVTFDYLRECAREGYLGLLSMRRESMNAHQIYLSKPSTTPIDTEQLALVTVITTINWDYKTRMVWRLDRNADRSFDVPDCVLDYISRKMNIGRALPVLLDVFSIDVISVIVKIMMKSDHADNLAKLLEETKKKF